MTQRESGYPEIADLADDLDSGLSLPAYWYTDPAITELERKRIFLRTWQYVGRIAQVAEVGDYFTATVLDLPVVVVRDEEGLRAFVNVCRHRRHLVMSGAGNKKVLQCPYHAWTYGLDGCLRAAPRSDRERDFDKEDYPLLPLRVDTWGPWVLVNADTEAEPLESVLGQWHFGADVPEDFAREMMAFDDQVGAEDDALTDSVQRGLQAGMPAQGRFLVESEQLVIRFQRMVLSALS